MTELAVREFQLHHGLKATGVADITTLRALGFAVPDARP
jgi:murein L,D-transpeptidase YcbB/YkuD